MRYYWVLLFSLCVHLGSAGAFPKRSEITFQYISLTEDKAITCTHEKADVGLHEWDVTCEVGSKVHKYFVHLVLHFYPKTVHGTNAYELLYWVTDMTDQNKPRHDSSTIWIHNSQEDNFMKVLEASQGIENDLAYLKLIVKLKAPIDEQNHSSF